MFKIKFVFLVFFIAASLSAQIVKPNWDEWDDWNDFKIDFGKSPYLELNYGFGQPKLKSVNTDFSKTGLIELRLGYRSQNELYDDFIIETKENYSSFMYISPELKSEDLNNSSLQVNAWRFGFGNLKGIGYQIGEVSIMPYTDMNFNWTKLDFKNISDYSLFYFNNQSQTLDTKQIDYYGNSLRFGTTSSAGIKLGVGSFISVNASYDASVVYPRHLFWKNIGSLAIEAIGGGFVDYFIDEVMDTTPEAGPILNILLKGSLSYAFYSLRRDDMNWPFGGISPITFEHFKIGMTFTF